MAGKQFKVVAPKWVPYCCCNKLPQIQWLKTAHRSCSSGGQKSNMDLCWLKSRYVSRAAFLLEALRRICFLSHPVFRSCYSSLTNCSFLHLQRVRAASSGHSHCDSSAFLWLRRAHWAIIQGTLYFKVSSLATVHPSASFIPPRHGAHSIQFRGTVAVHTTVLFTLVHSLVHSFIYLLKENTNSIVKVSLPPKNSSVWVKRFSSVQFRRSVVSDSLRPHGLQHARPPCPSPAPGVYSNSCPSSRWCHPTISSSVIPFSSTFNLSQYQGLFKWVTSSHQVAKVLEFQLQHQSLQ